PYNKCVARRILTKLRHSTAGEQSNQPEPLSRDLPEFVQRAQVIRPRLVLEGLRPVGPRHLAHIDVAAAVHRQAVGRQELGGTQARAKPAQAGNALAGVVDDGNPWAEVWDVAADRLHRAEFANVADWALAGRHEQAARAVQIVPLRLVFAV